MKLLYNSTNFFASLMSLKDIQVLIQTSFVLGFCFDCLAEVLAVTLVHADALSALMVVKK